ncbi:hypothetical protein B484DRAFT_409536 [Ochromonadaceae sp. CCMP2298]|nr:hypothetical protein B484DRAFT_409536 [Ochromonadaceae sp. CCMP2298]
MSKRLSASMHELNEKRECDWYDDAILVQALPILPPSKILQAIVVADPVCRLALAAWLHDYELGLGGVIVSHVWAIECLKAGKIVPFEPFAFTM